MPQNILDPIMFADDTYLSNNIRWFKSFLKNQIQYLKFNSKIKIFSSITCGVPQESIHRRPSLLIFINGLKNVLNILDPMLAANTNLIFSH